MIAAAALGMKRTEFVKVCLIATCVALAIIGTIYFYGTEVKDRSIWLTTKPMFPWAISACLLVFSIYIPYTKQFCFIMFLAYFVYGAGDIIIELGDAWLAPGAIAFLIGHIIFTVGLVKSKKARSESDLPKPISKCTRIILCVVLVVIYIALTATAIYIITSYSKDIAMIAISIIYPLSFATMSVLAVFNWRHMSSLVLNLVGALVYAASDVATAMQALIENQPWMHYFIMPSYWVALLLFAASLLPVVFRAAGYDDQFENQDIPMDVMYTAIPYYPQY